MRCPRCQAGVETRPRRQRPIQAPTHDRQGRNIVQITRCRSRRRTPVPDPKRSSIRAMQNRYTEPAASAAVPGRPSGITWLAPSIIACLHTDLDLAAFNVDGLAFIAGQRLRQTRFDEAERHGIDVDLQAAPLLRHRLGHAQDARLRRRIIDLPRVAASRDGRDVHHLAEHFAAFGRFGLGGSADDRIGRAQDAKRCREMAVHDRVPLLVAHLLNHVVPREASVVDDDVDALEVFHRGPDETLGEVGRRHAACAHHGLATLSADQFGHFVGRIGVEVVHDDTRAFGREFQCHFTANATAGAGNQCGLACELAHLDLPFCLIRVVL